LWQSRGNAFDVIAGHSRPKDGVASLAYDPAIRLFREAMDARVKPAHDSVLVDSHPTIVASIVPKPSNSPITGTFGSTGW
jgi:hypothetical protein